MFICLLNINVFSKRSEQAAKENSGTGAASPSYMDQVRDKMLARLEENNVTKNQVFPCGLCDKKFKGS